MVRAVLGEEGYRYFVGILGSVFIVASLGLAFIVVGGKSLLRSGESKTDKINIAIFSADPNAASSLMTTESQLKMRYDILGERELDTYQKISFRNNYRNTLPDILWKMRNLESIDLTNNKFTELPLEEFAKLPKLSQLILDDNPIEEKYMEQIRSTLAGIQVVKNDTVKP